ncbi:MAG: PepSY-associated TM helix domain-containing protein [Phocaeicola sp.]
MKKIMKKLHLWLSIPFGLIITITCFTGGALVFEKEITEALRPNLYFVESVGEQPLPLELLMEKVATTLPDSVSITGVTILPGANRAYQVNLSKPRRASLYVDQYTGEVKGKYERMPFFLFMFRAHRWLLDSMKPAGEIFWGKMIVGASTLAFVFVLLSGLIIWIPRSKKALANRLKITTGRGQHRFWYDLHVSGGFYALLLLLVMSLTGLTWSFPWYRNGFYALFGVEMQQQAHGAPAANSHGAPTQGRSGAEEQREARGTTGERGQRGGRSEQVGEEGERSKPSPYIHWQKIYNQLSQENPTYKNITISNGSATLAFNGWGNQRGSDKYSFHPRKGEITQVELYKDQAKSSKMRGWIYSVHVGSFGGMLTRILFCLAALFGASLPITGYYLWIKRSFFKKRRA